MDGAYLARTLVVGQVGVVYGAKSLGLACRSYSDPMTIRARVFR